ncbi:MAG TPA: class I SAM-dependent methyltransferase [Steroidobacteraceae bacterium]|jgi:SAM-dependent methyltransferase|nr:class I SAM-dependent methyltransferase [Steroidobacteraceae bacterium]
MMESPWLKIPLADYEAHMAAPNIDQASLLADVFSTLLRRFQPASVAVIGCAGGNGFEHIDPHMTTRVVTVDINPEYLEATARRHSAGCGNLTLLNADIAGMELPVEPVDLFYTALPSILQLAPLMRLVDPPDLAQVARGVGFALLEFTRVTSRAGKDFAIQIYRRPSGSVVNPWQ